MRNVMKTVMAAGSAMALLWGLPLPAFAQETKAILTESGELSQIAKYNDALDDEGRRLLNEFVQVLPKLDVKRLKNETAEKFPLSMLDKLKAEFDAKWAPFKIGEVITVVTRVKVHTGTFGGMKDGKMIVGNRLVPTIDLMQETVDRARPEVIAEKRREFLSKNYYEPKAAYMIQAKESIFLDRLDKLDTFYKAVAQSHTKGIGMPAGDNMNVAVVAPQPESSTDAQPLPGQNAPTLAAESKENLN